MRDLPYKKGNRAVSTLNRAEAMAATVGLGSLICLLHFLASASATAFPWSSSSANDSFSCHIRVSPPVSPERGSFTFACYLAEKREPLIAHSDGVLAIRGDLLDGQRSFLRSNGSATVTLATGDGERLRGIRERSCVLCRWYPEDGKEPQNCLTCHGLRIRTTVPESGSATELLESGVEIEASVPYFFCRFRVPRHPTDTVVMRSAWLSRERDRRGKDCSSPGACTSDARLIALSPDPSTAPYTMTVRTEVREPEEDDVCRVCLLRVGDSLTVGRACLDLERITLLRDVRVGRTVALGVWAACLIVATAALGRFLYSWLREFVRRRARGEKDPTSMTERGDRETLDPEPFSSPLPPFTPSAQ